MGSSAYVDWHADLLRRTEPPTVILWIGTLGCCLALPPLLVPWSFVVAAVGIGNAFCWLIDARVGMATHRTAIHPFHIVSCLFYLAGSAVGFVIASTILRDLPGASAPLWHQTLLAALFLGVAAAHCYWPASLGFVLMVAACANRQTSGPDTLTFGLMLAVPAIGFAALLAVTRLPPDRPGDREAAHADGHDRTVAVEDALAAVDQASARFLVLATGASPRAVELALDELSRSGRVERAPRTSVLIGGTSWRLGRGRTSIDPAPSAGT
jgi:hypothetical protein